MLIRIRYTFQSADYNTRWGDKLVIAENVTEALQTWHKLETSFVLSNLKDFRVFMVVTTGDNPVENMLPISEDQKNNFIALFAKECNV